MLNKKRGIHCNIKTKTKNFSQIVKTFMFREQPDHPDLPPAQPVWLGGALPAGYGQSVEIPGLGSGGLSQRQPLS